MKKKKRTRGLNTSMKATSFFAINKDAEAFFPFSFYIFPPLQHFADKELN